MKPEESALGNALLSLTLWLSDVYAAAIEVFRIKGELSAGNAFLFCSLVVKLCTGIT